MFTGSAVEGRLQAKTGTLGNAPYNADPPAVKSLSGYLPVDGGGAVEFSLILNAAGTLTDQSVYRPDLGPLRRGPGDVPQRPDPRRPRPPLTPDRSAFVQRRAARRREAHERGS